MILADRIEYTPKTITDQGKTESCAAYSFFGVLVENIQQAFNIDVEFDVLGEYERSGRKQRTGYYSKILTTKGFVTKDKKYLIQAKKTFCIDHKKVDQIREKLQTHGVLLWWVNLFKGWSLKTCNEKLQLKKLSLTADKKGERHGLSVNGFDKDLGFKFYNSWGEEASPRFVDTDSFKRATYVLIAFEGITLTLNK